MLIKNTYLILIFIFLNSQNLFADPEYCADLYKVACAPGSTSDVSGNVSKLNAGELIFKAIDKQKVAVVEKFARILSDPNQSYFRKSVSSVLGYKNNPHCMSTETKDIQACDQKMAEGLFYLAAAKITSYSPYQLPANTLLQDLAFVTENSNFRSVMKDLKNTLNASFSMQPLSDKVRDQIFPKAKASLVARLNSLNIEEKQKKLMIEKVKGIQFSGSDCDLGGSDGRISIDMALWPNAFYSPTRNDFHLCNGLMLQGQSEMGLLFVITHELAHSVDPCSMGIGPDETRIKYNERNLNTAESQYPINSLVKCLRDKNSINAVRFEGYMKMVSRKIFGKDHPFCSSDQIGESIADWFATEAFATNLVELEIRNQPIETLKVVSNVWKPLCKEESNHSDEDPHPRIKDRANRILLLNPQIRSMLNCTKYDTTAGYCDGLSAKPTFSMPSNVKIKNTEIKGKSIR